MTAPLWPKSLLAFTLPAHTSLLHPRSQRLSQKRTQSWTAIALSSPISWSDATRLSRRAMLVSAALSTSLVLDPPSHASAYSSPYKPGQKTEQILPDRLYEEAVKRVVKTPSGLQYFDLSEGSGTEAKAGNVAYVYYTSRLRGLNGIKIQSTYDDSTSPPVILKIGASDVVPGVSETLTGMRVGGKRRAVLPPNIAYTSPDMKPAVTEFFARRRLLSVLETQRDATIVFDFELVKLK